MLSKLAIEEMYKMQLGYEAARFCHDVTDWPLRILYHESIYLLGTILEYSYEQVDEDFSEAINKLIPQVIGA